MSQNPFHDRPDNDGLGVIVWSLAAISASCFCVAVAAAGAALRHSVSFPAVLRDMVTLFIALCGLSALYAIVRWWSRA